jgi:hypothetical protein
LRNLGCTYRLAIAEELRMNFDSAISCFEKAILNSLNDEKIKEYHADIERCRKKIEIIINHKEWQNKKEDGK